MTKQELLETLGMLLEKVEEAERISMSLSSRSLEDNGIYIIVDEGEENLIKFSSNLKDAIRELNR